MSDNIKPNVDKENLKYLLPYYIERNGRTIDRNGKFRCFNTMGHKNNDNTPSAGIIPGTNDEKWKCFACGEHGDIFDLVEIIEGISDFNKQVEFLCDMFNIDKKTNQIRPSSTNIAKLAPKKSTKYENLNAIFQNENTSSNVYYLKRGLSKETIQRLGLITIESGFAYLLEKYPNFFKEKIKQGNKDFYSQYKHIIPCEDEKGNIKNIIVRHDDSLDFPMWVVKNKAERKVLNLKGRPLTFFNQKVLKEYEKIDKVLFVAESWADAASIEECGYSCISLNGASNASRFIEKIANNENLSELIFIYAANNDEAGYKSVVDFTKGLKKYGLKGLSFKPHEVNDINDLLLSDRNSLEEILKTFKDEAIIKFTDNREAFPLSKETETETEIIEKLKAEEKEKQSMMKKPWYYVKESEDGGKNKPKLKHDFLAKFLNRTIENFYMADKFYFFIQGKYEEMQQNKVLSIIEKYITSSDTTPINLQKIYDLWTMYSKTVDTEEINQDSRYINLKNGIYDVTNGKLYKHSSDLYSTIQLPISYNPNAKCPNFKKYIEFAVNKQSLPVVQEMLGYFLIPGNKAKKLFLINGKTNTGKSVFINLVTEILGRKNVSALPLQTITSKNSTNFQLSEIYGKALNQCADNPQTAIEDSGTLKMLTGDDYISAPRKFMSNIEFRYTGKLLFSYNELPANYTDKTEAFYNRFIIIPFENQPEKKDKALNDKLSKELDGIFNWAIIGLQRLIENDYEFSDSKEIDSKLCEFKKQNNSVLCFIDETCIYNKTSGYEKVNEETFDKFYTKVTDLYQVYKEYMQSENSSKFAVKKKNFISELDSIGVKRIEKFSTKINNSRRQVNVFKGIIYNPNKADINTASFNSKLDEHMTYIKNDIESRLINDNDIELLEGEKNCPFL